MSGEDDACWLTELRLGNAGRLAVYFTTSAVQVRRATEECCQRLATLLQSKLLVWQNLFPHVIN